MISRNEYRGCVKANVLKEDWETALAQTKTLVQEQKEQNKVLTVCLYQHKNMLFLYMETLQDGICPQTLLAPLVPYMEQWPEENGLTPWAPMYHIYHHSIPGDVSEWVKERASNENRIGRIAFLNQKSCFLIPIGITQLFRKDCLREINISIYHCTKMFCFRILRSRVTT